MEEIRTKICTKCGKEKLLKEFYENKRYRSGYFHRCKVCERLRGLEYRKRNPEKSKRDARKWRIANPEKAREGVRKYYKANYEKILKINRDWKKTQKNNPKFRLSNSMSRAIRDSLKNSKEGKAWLVFVNYTLKDLIEHLEKLFVDGMTWENYGEWQIDHKIPISVFNFTKPENIDFKRCWKLSNLQPLWKRDNLSKHTKLIKAFQPSLLL